MRLAVVVYHRAGAVAAELLEGREVIIGRGPSADVVVQDDTVSREHIRVAVREQEVWVEDLTSRNGTFVNDEPVTRPTRVMAGDRVTLGGASMTLHSTATQGPPKDIEPHDRFATLVADEVLRARSFNRQLSLLMVKTSHEQRDSIPKWYPSVQGLLRPVDRMGLFSPHVLEIISPESAPEEALRVARAIVAAGETDAAQSTILCGCAFFPGTATTAEGLLAACYRAMGKATPDRPIRYEEFDGVQKLGQSDEAERSDAPVVASPSMRDLYATIQRIAVTDLPVLLLGETGTGKEVLAREVHSRSPRCAGPMIAINCGSIPPPLLESALFGHEKGAFTGAIRRKQGVFEAAHRGTLLLDEIGELPPSAQVALLRVLETKRVMRVGSTKEVAVDVRIVAATHRDLEQLCDSGMFRRDLWFRLNAAMVSVPPLRDRPEEILPLTEAFIASACHAKSCCTKALDESAAGSLQSYRWPGNVRELRNVVERAVALTEDAQIRLEDLPERVRTAQPKRRARGTEPSPTLASPDGSTQRAVAVTVPLPSGIDWPDDDLDYKTRIQEIETQIILDALRSTNGNQSEAARRLRIPMRTLTHKMRAFGIQRLGYGVHSKTASTTKKPR